MKRKISFMIFAGVVVLALAGCIGEATVETPASEEVVVSEDVFEEVPLEEVYGEALSEEVPEEGAGITLKEKLYDYEGYINVNGEMCNALWGKTCAIAWKYVGATFDEAEHFLYAKAIDITEAETTEPGAESWDACIDGGWNKLYTDSFPVEHAGDDMFVIPFMAEIWDDSRRDLKMLEKHYYINVKNPQENFYDYKICEHEADPFERITEFNDGYAICYWDSVHQAYYWSPPCITTMDECGNLNVSEITVSTIYLGDDEEIPCGGYSDGLFYYDRCFYDIEFNLVIELPPDYGTPYVNQGLYTPQFVDGVCVLVTEKNGLYWIFEIDKNGEIISEIEEFDIMLLNI